MFSQSHSLTLAISQSSTKLRTKNKHTTMINRQHWSEALTSEGAFWFHDEDIKRPHAELTSGRCSNGFFNGTIVTADPILLKPICTCLIENSTALGLDEVNYVVGPAVGAITFAYQIASEIQRLLKSRCCSAYTEKDESGKQTLKRLSSEAKGKTFLVCEDTITTGGSVEQTIQAVTSAGGIVLPFIYVICNRSGLTHLGEGLDRYEIVSLIQPDIKSWDPKECPLCQAGSKRLRPKQNWDELTKGGVE